jgi:hypothetical protein
MGFDPVSMGIAGATALASSVGGAASSSAPLAGMALSTGLSFLGANESAQGAMMQGQATSASDVFQSMVAMQNAQIEDQNAQWTMRAGEQNTYNAGLENRQQVGKIKSAQSASGVDVNSGSFVQARQSVENAGLTNEQNIEGMAAQKAYGFEQQAAADRAQAIFDNLSARESMMGAKVSANASLLDAGAHAAAQWLTPSTSTSTGPDGSKSVSIYSPASAALGALGTFMSGNDTSGGGADMMGDAFANSIY